MPIFARTKQRWFDLITGWAGLITGTGRGVTNQVDGHTQKTRVDTATTVHGIATSTELGDGTGFYPVPAAASPRAAAALFA